MKNISRAYLILIGLLFIIPKQIQSQSWQTVGNGILTNPFAYHTEGNDLYVAYGDTSHFGSKLYVSKWNGLFWTTYPDLFTPVPGRVVEKIFTFNNEVYVLGNFDSLTNITGSHGLVRFDGKSWKSVGSGIGNPLYSIRPVAIYNKKLYIANINKAGGLPVSHMACWDGVTWSKVGSPDSFKPGPTHINELKIFKGKLVVSGMFSEVGGVETSNIAFWNGTTWSAVGIAGNQGLENEADGVIPFNNKLLAYGPFNKAGNIFTHNVASWDSSGNWSSMNSNLKSGVFIFTLNNNIYLLGQDISDSIRFQQWNGSNWATLSSSFSSMVFQSYTVYNNKFWAVGNFKFYKNPNTYDLIVFDGVSWKPYLGEVPGGMSGQRNLFVCNNDLFLLGKFGNFNNVQFNNIAKLNNSIVVRIKGNLYKDFNTNCIRDTNEKSIPSHFITIEPGNTILCTDSDGYFEGYVDTGNITISLLPLKGNYKHWLVSPCNQDKISLHLTDTNSSLNNDFAIYPKPGVSDIRIMIAGQTGWRARKGFRENYHLIYENTGTTIIPGGTVCLTLDPHTVFQSCKPNYDSLSGNIYKWNFIDLKASEKREITFTARIDSLGIQLGDTLRFYSKILPLLNDSDVTDNYDTLNQQVVSAIDPNNKECYPDGDISQSLTKIDYYIHFQNTGSDTAYRVTVVDTIDNVHLPLNEIEIMATSHPYKLSGINNVLIWTFDDIHLPGENQDEVNSQGYIWFRAYIKPGLAIGTKIQNNACIYFDYMQYMPTNKTLNTITTGNSIPIHSDNSFIVQVFPNPATNQLNVLYHKGNNNYLNFSLFDILGKNMMNIVIEKNVQKVIDVGFLKEGIYILQSKDGKFVNKIIIEK